MTTTVPSSRSVRDPRLDVLRGIALITIFINHVPGNAYEHWTSRNFGFSDAAEGFVLMSGIAAGLAYARGFDNLPFSEAVARLWRRARKLYIVHLAIIAMAVGILWLGFSQFGTEEFARRTNFMRLMQEPVPGVVGIGSLGHQLAYFNILPLYIVLLMAAPVFILVGRRSLGAMVALSAAIWFAAGSFRINLPNFPGDGGWFFNPFAWQFLFVIGLAGGMAAKKGRSLVPYDPRLFWAAVAFLVFAAWWVLFVKASLPGHQMVPFFIGGFDKSFLPLPRLLHVLALAYVLINLPLVAALARSRFVAPIELMGKNSLPVFAAGSVLAMAIQLYAEIFEAEFLADTVLLATGLAIQYAFAVYASAGGWWQVPVLRQLRPQQARAQSSRPFATRR